MKKILIYSLIIIVVATIVFFVVRFFINRDSLDVDVSDIELNVEVERFDKELDLILLGDAYTRIEDMNEKYGAFFEVYNNEIIGIGGMENSSYLTYLNTFLNDYAVTEASLLVGETYSDMSVVNEELTEGFKHFLYYYPEAQIPRVVSFVAGFNHSVITMEGFIGIGLDKYLGAECELYEMLGIPEYATFEMQANQIPIDVMTAWAHDKFPYDSKDENLLKLMIYNGKILYFLDAMYPEMDEARTNKYTEDQLDFCYEFERELWTNIVENKYLFAADYLTIKKFVESAPYTNQFGPESPPRLANWLGLQIVRAYVENNDVSVQELMNETDAQKILNLSEYDPKY